MATPAPNDERLAHGFDLRALTPEFYHDPCPAAGDTAGTVLAFDVGA